MISRVVDPDESALTAMSRMTIENFVDVVAERVVSLLEAESGKDGAQSSDFMTAKAVAKRLGVSKRKLDSMIDLGVVPPPVFGGGHGSKRLWNPKDIEELRSAS